MDRICTCTFMLHAQFGECRAIARMIVFWRDYFYGSMYCGSWKDSLSLSLYALLLGCTYFQLQNSPRSRGADIYLILCSVTIRSPRFLHKYIAYIDYLPFLSVCMRLSVELLLLQALHSWRARAFRKRKKKWRQERDSSLSLSFSTFYGFEYIQASVCQELNEIIWLTHTPSPWFDYFLLRA